MTELLDRVCDKLGLHKLENIPQLKELSTKTHIKPAYFGIIFLSILSLMVLLEIGGFWIAFLVGFLYPAWASFKAIGTRQKEEDKQWFTYWALFGFIQVFDTVIYSLFRWVPFYSACKIALFIYLYHPKTHGALELYHKIIRPYLINYEGHEVIEATKDETLKSSKDNTTTEDIGDFDIIKKEE